MKELLILRRRVRNLSRCLVKLSNDIHSEERMNESMGREPDPFLRDLDRRICRAMDTDSSNENKQREAILRGAILRRAQMQDPV